MTVNQMREQLMGLYPGPGWRNKVKGMSDAQIIAIYYRRGSKKQI